MIKTSRVMGIVLAGGEGKRLKPLTRDRAKPAVPFGGRYRLIDFVLNNLVNSGILRIKVLTQFKSYSLHKHISRGWTLSPILNTYIESIPAQMRRGKDWFKGSADALYQNLDIILDERPEYICVFGADHVYKMDVQQMIDFHVKKGAALTISATVVPEEEAKAFGVIEVDKDNRVIGFQEKSSKPKTISNKPGFCYVSMGNYVFDTDVLARVLELDAKKEDSTHDFGKDVITYMYTRYPCFAYNFMDNNIIGMCERERGYWRDVGAIDSYYEASMDLISVDPVFNLYNPLWPLRSAYKYCGPTKFVFDDEEGNRIGYATDSIIAEGCIISGGHVSKSILFPRVRINSYCEVKNSILFSGVSVGRHAKVKNCVIDKNVYIPPHFEVGYDIKKDKEKFYVSPRGIVVIPKNYVIEG